MHWLAMYLVCGCKSNCLTTLLVFAAALFPVFNFSWRIAALSMNAPCLRALFDHDEPYFFQTLTGKGFPLASIQITTTGATLLYIAAQEGLPDAVTSLLKCGAKVDQARVSDGSTALFCACDSGQKDVVRVLLEIGKADPNKPNDDGLTPIFAACRVGNAEIGRLLLKYGANVDVRYDCYTPICIAAKEKHFDVVKLLVETTTVDINGKKGAVTPLFFACLNGDMNMVKLLLSHKADPLIEDKKLGTPLLAACSEGHSDIVKLILERYNVDINQPLGVDNRTCFFMACTRGQTEVTKILLQHEPNINSTVVGVTPLYTACSNGHLSIVELLLTHPDIDPNKCENMYGSFPLYMAAQNNHTAIVDLLLKHNVKVNSSCKANGATALVFSVINGSFEIMKKLLDAGADPNIPMNDGTTALLTASIRGLHTFVEALVQAGANINYRRPDGYTAMHIACRAGHVAVVEWLLSAGADYSATTQQGITPLDLCETVSFEVFFHLLLYPLNIFQATCTKDHTLERIYSEQTWKQRFQKSSGFSCMICGTGSENRKDLWPVSYCVSCMFPLCSNCIKHWTTRTDNHAAISCMIKQAMQKKKTNLEELCKPLQRKL